MKKTFTCLALLTLILSTSQVLASPVVYVAGAGSESTGTEPGTLTKIDAKNSLSLASLSATGLSFPSGGIQTVAVSPDQTKTYVSDRFSNLVYVIDTATNSLISSIPVSNDGEIVISPDGTKGYIPGHCQDTVINVLNLTNNTVSGSIETVSCPFSLAISPDGTKLYAGDVVSPTSYGVDVISTSTNTITATIPFNESSTSIGDLVAAKDKVYVADAGRYPFGTGNIVVIDASTNTISKLIPVGTAPLGLALTPDESKLYVVNFDSSSVSVIDTSTQTVTKTISLGADKDPTLIHITPDGTRAFVLNSFLNGDGHTEIAEINTSNDTLTSTVNIANAWFSFDFALFDRGFTKSGSNVTIKPDATTTITFSSVTASGDTSITQLASAPAAFSIKNNPVYLNISTTSTFTGTITICVKYTDEAGENSFKFLHFEGGKWVDRTTSLDTVNNIICGSVTSFSNFIVAIPPTPQDLIDKINTMGLEKGLTNSLTAKLKTAEVTENNLNAFINEVEAQNGKGLTEGQATELKDFATILIQLL